MSMTKVQARITLGLLSDDAVTALKVMERIVGPSQISLEGIQEIENLGLGHHMTNLLSTEGSPNDKVFVLTADGKKVAKQIERER